MAMTKKEQAAFEEALKRAQIVGALRWTSDRPVARDVKPPTPSTTDHPVSGWDFNLSTKQVKERWSTSFSHGDGPVRDDNYYRYASQGPLALYSTRLLALKALRYAAEEEAAHHLYAIDQLIAAEQAAQAATQETPHE